MGSAIRTTSARALAIQIGSERSIPWRRAKLMARSGAEELDEAILDLFVPLLELVRIHREELELGELRLVGGVLHLGMAGVEALAVRHHLLQLSAEGEVGEELGRIRMRREACDGRRGHDEGNAFLRIDDLDRVPLLLHLNSSSSSSSRHRSPPPVARRPPR